MLRRLTLLVGLSALMAAPLAACGDDEDDVTSVTTSTTDAVTTTTSEPREGAPLAAACSNDEDGYTISYPEDWEVQGCQYFDPESAAVEEGTEPDVAVVIDVDAVAFQRVRQGSTEGEAVAEVHTNEDVEVAGQRAALVEYIMSGQALYPEGSTYYGYLVDLGDRTLIADVVSARVADEATFASAKETLDQMIETLTLES